MDETTMDDSGPGLAYKVVELATVDEASLEEAVNTWVGRGWRLENVQFAMRESSRRPSMAFVFFTRPVARARIREVPAADERGASVEAGDEGDPAAALARLRQLAEHGATARRATSGGDSAREGAVVGAWERLRQLAEEDDGAPR